MVESRQAGGEILVEIDGTFDANAAWLLRGRLGAIATAHRVVLDFSRVREFHDLGIAVIANGLVDALRRNVELRGLRDHQHRLFRYFGVGADDASSGERDRRPAGDLLL